MDTEKFRKIQKKLCKKLDDRRYQHTLGVMYTCAALAMAHGQDKLSLPDFCMTAPNVSPIKRSSNSVKNTKYQLLLWKRKAHICCMQNWALISHGKNMG